MTSDGLTQVIDRFINDPAFREQFQRDRKQAIASAHITLSPEEAAALESMDIHLPDEPLPPRITKG